ncbi:Calmodulin-like protein 1 [Eumeta japonica]|uniref:Calmodulin-like protein 1 n=1 Tax=Eumeta variegata TaxID=151549 RepID=A0A4C1SNJ3_EUMVA|nr:Calmodulin-like protein 1 [Eumeta japonica]
MTSKERDMVIEEEEKETKEVIEKESIENKDATDIEGNGKDEIEEENVVYVHVSTQEIEKHVEDEELKYEEVEERTYIKEQYVDNETKEAQHVEGEHNEPKSISEAESNVVFEGEQLEGEQMEGEQLEGEQLEGEQFMEEQEVKEKVKIEEEAVVEEDEIKSETLIPLDPAAPLNLTDSKELLREPFELRPDQVVEIEQLWEVFQDYTPAYTDIQGYITEAELVYMLKALLLMTYTTEQMRELTEFCVRPPNPHGHISYEQFLNIVTLRQRDYAIEEELKNALKVLDPNNTGKIDRDYFRYVVGELGEKMLPKILNKFLAEVDLNNDGELGFEDIYGTMCNDLGQDDIERLKKALITPVKEEVEEEEDSI